VPVRDNPKLCLNTALALGNALAELMQDAKARGQDAHVHHLAFGGDQTARGTRRSRNESAGIASALFRGLSGGICRSIQMRGMPLQSAGVEAFDECFASILPTLRSLEMDGCEIDRDSAFVLAKQIKQHAASVLNRVVIIEGAKQDATKRCGDDSAAAIVDALAAPRELILCNVGARETTVQAVANVLLRQSSLTRLILDSTRFTTDSMATLADALKGSSASELSLSGCNLNSDVVHPLFDSIKDNTEQAHGTRC
jgi:hypothetical protein